MAYLVSLFQRWAPVLEKAFAMDKHIAEPVYDLMRTMLEEHVVEQARGLLEQVCGRKPTL